MPAPLESGEHASCSLGAAATPLVQIVDTISLPAPNPRRLGVGASCVGREASLTAPCPPGSSSAPIPGRGGVGPGCVVLALPDLSPVASEGPTLGVCPLPDRDEYA